MITQLNKTCLGHLENSVLTDYCCPDFTHHIEIPIIYNQDGYWFMEVGRVQGINPLIFSEGVTSRSRWSVFSVSSHWANLWRKKSVTCGVARNLGISLKNWENRGTPPRSPRRGFQETSQAGLPLHPAHGSWLNPAEIEISALLRQCLNRRIGDEFTLAVEVATWEA